MNRPSPELPRDEELVSNYLRGEKAAFHTLFRRYKNGIWGLVRHFFKNKERSEEVFQEVFLKLLEKLKNFDGEGPFRSWFYTLCRNHCIDRLRHQLRRPETSESNLRGNEDGPPTLVLNTPSREPLPDLQAYDRELAALLDEALDKLPQEQRETFLLKERGGLTFEEIAKLTEVSVNTVKSRMRYALESLRRSLKNKSFVKEALR
jgi:RNA polymerase sigma-70 factor, ECF subfamily